MKKMINLLNIFKKEKVITRIAPSPTGVMHIGTARTALFNYLFAKQNQGEFILRIEDTDKERSTKEFEKDITDSLEWLGLEYKNLYRQSERTEIYKKYLDKLISENKAYISKEEKGERDSVVRFRNPNKIVKFDDMIRGEIEFDTTELGDFVIAKSTEEPLYHLAVVVDDHEMNITHILRGEDGISNTPRQILIQEAIGAKRPKYAHLPLILGPDKSKLSKRHGATSLTEFKNKGYLKEALINHLALLGWNPGNDNEIFSLEELIKEFKIENVSKGGAVFNIEKLNWFNKKYIEKLPQQDLEKIIENKISHFENYNQKIIEKIIPIIIERIEKFEDIDEMIKEGELDYYFKKPTSYNSENLIWKKSDKENTLKNLKEVLKIIENNPEKNKVEDIKNMIWDYAEKEGRGDVLWPLRYSLSGKDKSPDPFVLISVLGKKESIDRINLALSKLNENK